MNSFTSKKNKFQKLKGDEVIFDNPHPDIHIANIPIATACWVKTTEGIVVIDTLLRNIHGEQMYNKIKTTTDGIIKYLIITHGHRDHHGGYRPFMQDSPEIITQSLFLERLEKYKIQAPYQDRVKSIQFNMPMKKVTPEQLEKWRQIKYISPTKLYDEFFSFKLGDKTFELYHARGETDCATWVWIPEIKVAFVGDLLIGRFPNIGNPFKPTRFALPWARALEKIREKKPKMIIHGGYYHPVYKDYEVREVLDHTIEAIHIIHDQVIDYINNGVPLYDFINKVKLPEYLKKSPYLTSQYSRIEFAVQNIYRWYHGYFDFNPAHLLPVPEATINREILSLIGNKASILNRVQELISKHKLQLALQVLNIILFEDMKNVEARKLRLKILKEIREEDNCMMSFNIWTYYINEDKKFISYYKS